MTTFLPSRRQHSLQSSSVDMPSNSDQNACGKQYQHSLQNGYKAMYPMKNNRTNLPSKRTSKTPIERDFNSKTLRERSVDRCKITTKHLYSPERKVKTEYCKYSTICPAAFQNLYQRVTFISVVLLLTNISAANEITEEQRFKYRRERAETAKKWAPVVFLHPKERYFPSSVHTFLQKVTPRYVPQSERPPDPAVHMPMSRSLNTLPLPAGVNGESIYLMAPIDANCKNCPLPEFLHGVKPSAKYYPPIYATITSCLPSNNPRRQSRTIVEPQRRHRRKKRFMFGIRRRFSLRGLIKRHPRHVYQQTPEHYNGAPHVGNNSLSSNSLNGKEHVNLLTAKEYMKKIRNTKNKHHSKPSPTLLPPKSWIKRTSPSTIFIIENKMTPTPDFFRGKPNSFGPITKPSNKYEQVDLIVIQEPIPTEQKIFNKTAIHKHDNDTLKVSLKSEGKIKPATLIRKSIHKQRVEEKQKISPGKVKHKEKNTEKDGHRYTVTYWMFYPFSQGKKVCTSNFWLLGRVFKPRLRNKCYGEDITLNSHVGDWEHISIYFVDSTPQRMYVSTHSYGAFYRYEPRDNVFLYTGKDKRKGLPLKPKYPPVLKLDGTHPVLYSALGSHGLWASPGEHIYEHLLPLSDKTGTGIAWKTWKNIDIIDYKDPDYDRVDRQWLHFLGRWGNPASGCHKGLFGSCDLAQGPTGIPLKRENFPCNDPLHPTFFPEI